MLVDLQLVNKPIHVKTYFRENNANNNMNYEYVKELFNVNPSFSSTVRLWKHLPTKTYYVSYDQRELIK